MTQLPMIPGAILGYTKRGTPIRVIAGGALNVDTLPSEPEEFQAYLDECNTDSLPSLENALKARFKELYGSDRANDPETGADVLQQLSTLKNHIHATQQEQQTRRDNALKSQAEETARAHRDALAALNDSVFGDDDEPESDPVPVDDDDPESLGARMAKAFETGLTKAFEGIQPQGNGSVVAGGQDLNSHIRRVPLSQIARQTPDPKVAGRRREATLIASADIPGRAKNGVVEGIGDLVKLMGNRSRMLPNTKGNPNYVPVAYLKRDFRYHLNLDSTPEEINGVLTAAADVNALVAAGGWCAPSEISYDFFNIVCEDGLVDLPSVGILNRGGFRFPVSPTIADIFGDPNVLWSWTEAQDESAADNGDTKTCARVACPEFDEVRASCDGLCVTAGNLTDFAYPEMIENYLQTVMAARAHRTNQIVIDELVDGSTIVDMTGSFEGTAASVLNSAELQAIDYRERFRMCEDAVVEAVFPRWVVGAIRADLANRNGLALFEVTSAMVADWFNIRNIRAQFVADWQAGFAGDPFGDPGVIPTAWPTTVDYLIYAPGTWVRGQALQLDLGVVRDSVLNEKNDHTAAWMEDCYAIAQVGHESRIVTTDVCASGVTGAGELICNPS